MKKTKTINVSTVNTQNCTCPNPTYHARLAALSGKTVIDPALCLKSPKQSEFERGALWALELFKGLVAEQIDDVKSAKDNAPDALCGILNGVENLLERTVIDFESAVIRQVQPKLVVQDES
jgi:hypothetical protein